MSNKIEPSPSPTSFAEEPSQRPDERLACQDVDHVNAATTKLVSQLFAALLDEALIRRTCASGARVQQHQFAGFGIEQFDGHERVIHVEAEPEFNEHGVCAGYSGIVQDVTDRVAAEVVHDYLWSFQYTIAAGTSQIQRNVIAERILGMPKGR